MNLGRRGFLRLLVTTAAGVLVPADALTSPERVYFDMGRKRWLEYGALVGGIMRVTRPGIYHVRAASFQPEWPHEQCDEEEWSIGLLIDHDAIERGREIALDAAAIAPGAHPKLASIVAYRVGGIMSEDYSSSLSEWWFPHPIDYIASTTQRLP